jgi:hypothetical protein
MRRLLWLAVATLGVTGTASAQSEADRADGRCFIALQMFKAAALKQGQMTAESGVTVDKMGAFYLGRIRGRNPVSAPIAAIITPEIARAATINYLKDAPACIDDAKQYSIDFKAIVPIIQEATRQMAAEVEQLEKSGN